MYVAPTTTASGDRLIAGAITALILFGILGALRWAQLPEVKQRTDVYEEINWARFTPKPKKIVAPPPRPVPVEAPEPVRIEMPVAQTPAPVQKIDLSALKAQFEPVAKPARTLSAEQSPRESASRNASGGKIRLEKSTLLGGLNPLLGDSAPRLAIERSGRKGHGGTAAPTLKVGRGSSASAGTGPDYGGGTPALAGPERKEEAAGAEIGMLDLAKIGADFQDLSPVYRALIAWMKNNPGRFPGVVSRFMERAPGDLTSVVTFQIDGRPFQMYLMCKQKLFEVRVCLLENNRSTYLIDRGFKKNSTFLRVGSVNRTPDGNILSFGTTRRAASDRRTSEFYQIFLSWWESVSQ